MPGSQSQARVATERGAGAETSTKLAVAMTPDTSTARAFIFTVSKSIGLIEQQVYNQKSDNSRQL